LCKRKDRLHPKPVLSIYQGLPPKKDFSATNQPHAYADSKNGIHRQRKKDRMFCNRKNNVFLQRKQCFASEKAMFSTTSGTEAQFSSENNVFT